MIHFYTTQSFLSELVSAVPSRSTMCEATLAARDGSATLSVVVDGGATRARIRRAVDVQRPGEVVVSASVFRDAVRGLPKGTVEVKQSATKLTLAAGGSRVTIPVIPDAPPSWWTPPEPVGAWRFDASALVLALRRVRPAVAVDDVRWGINGAHVEADGDRARFVGTDRHRLHTACVPAEVAGTLPSRVVIPIAALDGIMAAASVGSVSLLIEASAVTLWTGDDVLSWAMVDGEFPDWRQVVPSGERAHIVARAGDLSAALKRHIAGAAKPTRVEFSRDALTLTTLNDVTEVVDTVAIELDGPVPREIGVNARYMMEAIASFAAGDFVTLTARDIGTPFRVCESLDNHDFGIVMPMRLA